MEPAASDLLQRVYAGYTGQRALGNRVDRTPVCLTREYIAQVAERPHP